MRPVLVLRPQPGGNATVERARERGLDAILLPMFIVEPVAWDVPEPGQFDGLLLTSANAVRHGGSELEALRGMKVYAVGGATAKAASEAGFAIAAVGDMGVDQLLGAIDPELKLVHLCGAARRAPRAARQSITPITVYKAQPIDRSDLANMRDSIALIHSPSAGRRFAELVKNRESIAIAAISSAAAEAVGHGWKTIEVADQPSDKALLALAARLCNNPDPE